MVLLSQSRFLEEDLSDATGTVEEAYIKAFWKAKRGCRNGNKPAPSPLGRVLNGHEDNNIGALCHCDII